MQVDIRKIEKYCAEYLHTAKFKDFCHNGLQVEGASKAGSMISGVSFSKKLVEAAIKKKAKIIIVHHGIFKDQISALPRIHGIIRQRLKLLLENNINLFGFHLPLDAHPVIGNNISLLKLFGLKKKEVIISPDYGEIGFIGEFDQSVKFVDFIKIVNEKLETNAYTIPAGPTKIKTVGIISGGASPEFEIAADMGADTYICGDVRESVVRAVEEKGINFINAWHYNTEKLGVQNLGKLIAKKFNIKHEFIDIPCDI